MHHKQLLAMMAISIAFVLWGASGSIFKLGLQTIDPFVFGYIRFIIAGLMLAGLLLFSGSFTKVHSKDVPSIILIGFLGVFIKIALILYALPHVSAIFLSLAFAGVPVLSYFASLWFFKEPFNTKTCVGMCIAFIGLLVAIFATGSTGVHFNVFYILVLVAMFLEVWFLIMSKKTLSHVHPLSYTCYTFLVAAVAFAPFALVSSIQNPFILTTQGLYSLLFATLGSSIVAYFLYAYGLHYLKGNKASILGFLDPVSCFIIAPIILGEQPVPIQFVGLAIVVVGVYIAEHTFLHKHGIRTGLHTLK